MAPELGFPADVRIEYVVASEGLERCIRICKDVWTSFRRLVSWQNTIAGGCVSLVFHRRTITVM